MRKDLKHVIIGIHRSIRECVGWAGREGFVPLTGERRFNSPPVQLMPIDGNTAEELMKHITKRSTSVKYEFVLVPLLERTTQLEEGTSESGLILPHLH